MIDTLRLLLTDKCERTCAGCCNNAYLLKELPVCVDYTPYKTICLTGGEPMLCPSHVLETVRKIREQTNYPIYLYTADVRDTGLVWRVLKKINGLTLTLHGRGDIEPFERLNNLFLSFRESSVQWVERLSLRLNVFKTAHFVSGWTNTKYWDTRLDMDWDLGCPLPENEIFMRTEELCPERDTTPYLLPSEMVCPQVSGVVDRPTTSTHYPQR